MAQSAPFLRLGTRGSALALWQAHEVQRCLAAQHGVATTDIEIVVIKTTGDVIVDRALAQAGGKGLFTKEIEEALLDGRIDLAVHSAKDMPTVLPPGLELSAYLPREDVRDVLITRGATRIVDLPQGGRLGSASLRRQALLKRLRPDLAVALLRGNVETRLRRVADGAVDATLLAFAGLKRLGLLTALPEGVVATPLSLADVPPAVGQGAVAIETRCEDERTRALVAAIGDVATQCAVIAERALLHALDGSCRTPIAGHATLVGERLTVRGLIALPDGSVAHETTREGAAADAAALGQSVGEALKQMGGPDFFAALADH